MVNILSLKLDQIINSLRDGIEVLVLKWDKIEGQNKTAEKLIQNIIERLKKSLMEAHKIEELIK